MHRQTHVSDHIIERTALPDNLIRGAAGQLAYEDMQMMVYAFDFILITVPLSLQL